MVSLHIYIYPLLDTLGRTYPRSNNPQLESCDLSEAVIRLHLLRCVTTSRD